MIKVNRFLSLLILIIIAACSSEDFDSSFLDNAEAPSNISALFTITQDNTGKVTIRPNGDGITSYKIYFGDQTVEPAVLGAGQQTSHIYAEGDYSVRIVGVGINGKETEITKPLTVTFVAPENLVVTIASQVGDPYTFNVSAAADFETFFEITFGEDPLQTPIQFNQGETISHTYSTIGEYEIKVTAFSGGAATTSFTQNVTVFDPVLLPVNFESPTLNYSFENFGGAVTTVINNPDISSGNTSAKVAQLNKMNGSEVWAGSFLTLDSPIDFSQQQRISIKTWSPAAGTVIRLKIENLTNPNVFVEVDQVTTVGNSWETLIFDFTGVNPSNTYQKVVIFFAFGTNGTGANYYFDDIMLTDGVEQLVLPVTFESATLAYDFGNFGGANTTVVNNPAPSGVNSSLKVAQLIKNAGAEVWAGSALALSQPIDFSSFQKIKMKVWSPAAGTTILLKLENLNNANINVEVPATTTVANGWEELTYNFAGINNANQYQRVIVFCGFGTVGNGSTYYFDDIQLTN